jgi:hypothetical protein
VLCGSLGHSCHWNSKPNNRGKKLPSPVQRKLVCADDSYGLRAFGKPVPALASIILAASGRWADVFAVRPMNHKFFYSVIQFGMLGRVRYFCGHNAVYLIGWKIVRCIIMTG